MANHFLRFLSRMTPLLLFLLPVFAVQAQIGWDPEEYDGIPETDKMPVFVDHFEDNRNDWNLDSDLMRLNIDESCLFLQTLDDHTCVKRKEVFLQDKWDYEIEMAIRYLSGPSVGVSAFGLTFGRDDSGNEFDFYLAADRTFKITSYVNGNYHDFTGWQNMSPAEAGSFSLLTVRKYGKYWYFFLDKKFVHQEPAGRFFGSDIGITIGDQMKIAVDYIRVKRLNSEEPILPYFSIYEPKALATQKYTILKQNPLRIRGKVGGGTGIEIVLFNDKKIPFSGTGEFEAEMDLKPGNNRIELVAQDRNGDLAREVFYVEYAHQPQRGYSGKNYLVMIGINEYQGWPKLRNAVKDCEDIARVLIRDYQFEPENLIRLYDQEATRENIVETFDSLQGLLREEDNLVVYYAGHGFLGKAGLGYWVPVEAREDRISDYIRNSTIHDYAKTIQTHHTFLIVDACYAGTLFFRGGGISNEDNRSRWAFTSGDVEKVVDGEPGENSPFAANLLEFLANFPGDRVRTDLLIEEVTDMVKRDVQKQSPQGSPLEDVGDEGGVFYFYKR
jgi:hypothetical protein